MKGKELSEVQRANISGFIRESQGIFIREDDLAFLELLRTPSVGEKAIKLMRRIAREFPSAGQSFMINYWTIPALLKIIQTDTGEEYQADTSFSKGCAESLPWLAISWAFNFDEFDFLIRGYLQESSGFLGSGRADGWFVITPRGWNFLDSLRVSDSDSMSAFVAMWFDPSVHPAWLKAVAPGIEDAGYEAIRIDKVEHNRKIDDEIIASIRACKFLVADFTGQRGGVYFEAGLAQGLGKQVVWLCRKDELDKVHFDTRQYNFILWEDGKLAELRTALQNRIEATIGKGTFRKA